jgi:3-oxoacyl-[acyl-carrier protein] reductase
VTSTAGQRGEAFYSPYAASKGAMISATKAWASELAPHVRVNSVAPGWVDTDMSADALAGDGREEIEATIPLGLGTPRRSPGRSSSWPRRWPVSSPATVNVNGGAVLIG